jgi:uroporphyrin-3 C-methyltransferase
MSEQKEKVEKHLPTKHKPKVQSSGSSGAFLAMVIALAAGGGSYYVWQQHLIAEQDREALEQSIEQLLEVVQQQEQAQLVRIEQLREHRHDNVATRLDELERSLPDLSQQLSVQQRDWTLAEVDYLLRIAEHRLQLNRDIPTAISALQQARDQLIKRTNGMFTAVIGTIDENIQQLATLNQNGTGQISAKLGQLLADLDSLPFALQAEQEKQPRQTPAPAAEGAELADKIKHWGRVVWHDIKSLVTIRRSDETHQPLINPEQRYLLQAQLRLKLETARLSAVGHDQALYQASLDEAAGWLNRYYDNSEAAVSDSYALLNQLAELNVDPQLPSLQPIRQLLHTARQALPMPAMPAPAAVELAPEPEPLLTPEVPELVPGVAPESTPSSSVEESGSGQQP